MGVFLVDSFCLGVKDAFLSEIMEVDWADQLARMIPEDERLAIHPACARKYIEGAVAYAESLGFLLHRDFKKARRAFGSVAASDCSEAFTYGKDGKPFFVAGPNDDEDRIKRVMSVLTARFGPKGFHCILPVEDEEDLQEDELLEEELREFFEARGRPDDRNILGGLCSAEPESSRRI